MEGLAAGVAPAALSLATRGRRRNARVPIMAAMAATNDPQTAPPSPNPSPGLAEDAEVALVEDDLLVEEISIDGMCGVY